MYEILQHKYLMVLYKKIVHYFISEISLDGILSQFYMLYLQQGKNANMLWNSSVAKEILET